VVRGTPDLHQGPRSVGPPTSDVGWGGRSEEIDFDDRSLAEVAFEASGSFEAIDIADLAPPAPRNPPPPPSRPQPPPAPRAPPDAARRPPRAISPADTVVKGVGHRETEGADRYQPRVAPRPIKERGRYRAAPQAAQGGGSLQQKADLLFQEALKEIAVGNLEGARRHLKLAVSFSPQDPRIQGALHNLGTG